MDSLVNLLVGDLEVAPEMIVTVKMIVCMFALEILASVVHFLGGFGRR